jgi:hypothetical protein
MVYHTTSFVGQNLQNPRNADLYFNIQLHNEANASCERWIALDNILQEVNPSAHLYKSMRQVFEEE